MICNKCKIQKQINEMRKGKNICKSCTNARFMKWKHESGFVQYQKNHRIANIKLVNETQRKYNEKHRERLNKLQCERRKTDINFKLSGLLRNRVSRAIKFGSAVRDLGCSIDELKLHLESKFQSEMTWENHGKWHIDHIIPLCSFDLTNRDQFLQACHYTNLQPLWATDNIRKGGKLVQVDIITKDGDLR